MIQLTEQEWKTVTDFCEAAIAVRKYLKASNDVQVSDAMYRPQSWVLREAADDLDNKDAAVRRYREALNTLLAYKGPAISS